MRASDVAFVSVLTVALATALSAQSDQPVFRTGVEVMEVDVSVVDDKGKPVSNLRAPEFTVTIDGQPRRVVSAEYVSDAANPAGQPVTQDPYVSVNSDTRPSRLIILVVDRNNIQSYALRGTMAAAKSFIKGLAPTDRLALATIPPPGPSIDFTTNHELVASALDRVVGMDDSPPGRFEISDYEAIVFREGSNPIAIQRLLDRSCNDADPIFMSACDRDVEQEAMTIAGHIRQQTTESVSGMAQLLQGLKDVDGAKSLIMLSQGLKLQGTHPEASHLAGLAAEARVNINVLLFDTNEYDASRARPSQTSSEDRALREGGLDTLASRSRGSLFRVLTNPQYVFDRISDEIAGYYLLGVEPSARDRDGKPHQIRVQVNRRDVSVRSRRVVQYAAPSTDVMARDESMRRVLRSPAGRSDLSMRLSSYVYRDTDPSKVRMIMAAEINPPSGAEKGVDLALGFALYDRNGNPVASGQERKIYSPNAELPIRYEMSLPVDPGTYRIKLVAIDADGKSGSVERDVQAFQMGSQELAIGDLLLSPVQEIRLGEIRPAVVLQVKEGQFVTYTELYTSKAGSLNETKVVFEVADTVDGPTLQSSPAEVRERPDGTQQQAMAIVPVAALPPGRYIARAVVTASGKTVGKLSRPFDVLPGSRAAAPAPVAAPTATPEVAVAPTVVAPVQRTGIVIPTTPRAFSRDDVLKPEMLRAAFDVIARSHPAAKGALARARSGKLEGTALMALDAGDQAAGSLLRGLEFLSKGQLDPAATQFGLSLRSAADSPIASFYLGACFAAGGKDREAVSNWERARAAKLAMPDLQVLLADGWLRLGQPTQAIGPLKEALERQPQNDNVRKNLAVTQSHLGFHEEAYPTIVPFLEKHPSDPDALLVALHALYQLRVEEKVIASPDEDRQQAALYARAYEAAKGPLLPLVSKWAEFLAR